MAGAKQTDSDIAQAKQNDSDIAWEKQNDRDVAQAKQNDRDMDRAIVMYAVEIQITAELFLGVSELPL